MATMAFGTAPRSEGHGLFLGLAIAMAITIAAGFSMQLAMGRSTFAAPWPVHFHALVFFGWTALYVLQNALIATGSVALHRRLGWIGAGWAAAVVVIGIATTVMMVRRGGAPFFFQPAFFLFMNSLSVLCFGALFAAAIRLRRRNDWHRRLMTCGMAGLTGPAVGRLLPMPLLMPWAAWAVFAAMMIFPLVGMVLDARRRGRIHPAWLWGIGALTVTQIAMGVVAGSAPGLAVYDLATAGAPGAAVPPLAYPAPPAGMLTGSP